jgi:group I intron endonuclease
MTYEAFVYCWTDTANQKLYVGSHKGKIDDGYICSSKIMKEEYVKRPNDFVRQIVATGNYKDIRNLESSILKSVDAKKDKLFYNMHNSDGDFYLKKHSDASKKKISEGHKGKLRPDLSVRNKLGMTAEQKIKMANTKKSKGQYLTENCPMFGKKHTDNTKKIQSEMKIGEKNPMFGKTLSDETKAKMAIAKKAWWDNKKGLI